MLPTIYKNLERENNERVKGKKKERKKQKSLAIFQLYSASRSINSRATGKREHSSDIPARLLRNSETSHSQTELKDL